MTYSYERFLKEMTLRTSEHVILENIAYETIELYSGEMDERFFTEDEFKALPDVCMVTAINYWTKERNEYLMMDVYDESNQRHVKIIWLKNGEIQLENN